MCWYIYIPEPYCISSASHRWRLEEASGLHSPPARMWWTLNYLADRSYSPPAPNRGLCQALTSTSSPHTRHLTKQIYAYGLHSFLMLSFSGFLFPLCSRFVVFFDGNMRWERNTQMTCKRHYHSQISLIKFVSVRYVKTWRFPIAQLCVFEWPNGEAFLNFWWWLTDCKCKLSTFLNNCKYSVLFWVHCLFSHQFMRSSGLRYIIAMYCWHLNTTTPRQMVQCVEEEVLTFSMTANLMPEQLDISVTFARLTGRHVCEPCDN